MGFLGRRVRAFVHNETPHELSRLRDRVSSGEWGREGALRPPPTLAPMSVTRMGTDSTFGVGASSEVTYRIGRGPDEVRLVWDNPLVGTNSYEHRTSNEFYVFHTGGGGDLAEVHFYLRTSEVRSTGFRPSLHGFRFTNSFGDVPYSLPPLRGTSLDLKWGNAANGLCGGMALAARDYFVAGRAIPEPDQPPMGEQDPLFVYLVDRLFDTFSVENLTYLYKLMSPLVPETSGVSFGLLDLITPHLATTREIWNELIGSRSAAVVDTEWPLIRRDLDAGRPTLITLVTVLSLLPTDLGLNHQVLAYAYEGHDEEVTLHVYDPNAPRDEADGIRIRFTPRSADEPIGYAHNAFVLGPDKRTRRPVRCLFRMDFTPRDPLPGTGPITLAPDAYAKQVLLSIEGEASDSVLVSSGRREFSVMGGECGRQAFDYELARDVWRYTVSGKVFGVEAEAADPGSGRGLRWLLNGVEVPRARQEQRIPAEQRLGRPVRIEDFDSTEPDEWLPGHVRVRTEVIDGTLHIRTHRDDGNWKLQIQCAYGAPGDPIYIARTETLIVRGDRFESPQLDRANAACMVKLLRALQEAPPSEEELVAQLIAAMTLNRPPDPVWCPDPLMIDSGWNDALTDPADEFVHAVEDPANEVHEVAFDQWAVLETATVPDGTRGTETLATETPGRETWAVETPGPETWAVETPGPEAWAVETPGPETLATETAGPEARATETPGPEAVGPETTDADLAVAPAVEALDVEEVDGAGP